jgi:hypothetical protein
LVVKEKAGPPNAPITRKTTPSSAGPDGHSKRAEGATVGPNNAVTVATVAAAYLPARRAASLDPILALREE